MNPYTQLNGQDATVSLGWESLVSEAAYKMVTVFERLFAR